MLREQLRLRNAHIHEQRQQLSEEKQEKMPGGSAARHASGLLFGNLDEDTILSYNRPCCLLWVRIGEIYCKFLKCLNSNPGFGGFEHTCCSPDLINQAGKCL